MFDIIYQDQNLLVINKPNNLAVQKTNKYAESLEEISFQVNERLNNHTFLKVFPLTGRTHQIRVAFQKINHPIYNDPLYSSVCVNPEIGQYLHAHSLEFSGSKKEKFLFQAPLP